MDQKGQSQYIQKHEKAAREKRDRDTHAESISALHSLKQSYIDVHKDDKSREKSKNVREYLTIVLLVCTAVFTGLTYYIFKETEINDLRPWLFARSVSNFHNDPNSGFDIDVLIKNYGKTVANNASMTGFLALNLSNYNALQRGLKKRCANEPEISRFQLPQGDETQRMLNVFNWPPGERDIAVDPESFRLGNYFLFGCITYADQFGKAYSTKFCYRPEGHAKSAARDDIVAVPLKPCGFFDETT